MKFTKEELKSKLQSVLNRVPKEEEIVNAEKDPKIICDILSDKIDELLAKISSIEKKLWP